jgi:hypothetical protein
MRVKQKPQPKKPRVVTVECECGARFTAPNRLRRLCVDCKQLRLEARLETMRSRGAGSRPPRPPRKAPFTLRTDFLLALPELRRELERALTVFDPLPHIEGSDPLDLGTRRSA